MKTLHSFIALNILLKSSTALYNSSFSRNDPSLPLVGTKNWERINDAVYNIFSPRHGHATCKFKCPYNNKTCIWLTGGRTEPYRTFDLYYEDRAADIWWSETGAAWNKVLDITGDFLRGVGNHDAKIGGEVAPWYGRFGHSLDAMDIDDDRIDDVLLLMGGFNPIASNDIWISTNGTSWFFVHYADWPERAYHATVVFQKKIWVMGGSPLTNDVWSGDIVQDKDDHKRLKIRWKQEVAHRQAPWAPRAGMCSIVQYRKERIANGLVEGKGYIYLIGGYAEWPKDDYRWDDGRTRNDVWISSNGKDWSRVNPANGANSMPFVGRGWHSCITWHDHLDKFKRVGGLYNVHDSSNLTDEELKTTWPQIYLVGGGYMGTKGNNAVTVLEGYLDLWFSQDGSKWIKVNYQEGRKESQYSTNEWTRTLVKDSFIYLGKWGHTIESILIDEDMNNDGRFSATNVEIQICTLSSRIDETCKLVNSTEHDHPVLILIGGDTTDGGPIVNDVFMSKPGVLCEVDGISCNGHGACSPIGCICNNSSFYGDYCENIYPLTSIGDMYLPPSSMISATLLAFILAFAW